MAHEIDLVSRTDLNGSMAYTGEVPWHGLGQQLDPNSPLEVWADQAGMAFDIEEAPVLWYDETTTEVESFEGRKVLLRSDTRAGLSIVSDSYQVVQPRQVLEFYRDLIGDAGFTMETAGVLFNGKRYWAAARIGQTAKIGGLNEDVVDGYLMLCTSCDTSLATTAAFTAIRPVCNNTLTLAYNGLEDGQAHRYIKIPHNLSFNPDEVKGKLGLAENAWSEFVEHSNQLATTKMSDDASFEFFKALMGDVQSKAFQKVVQLYAGEGHGSHLKTARGTAWGAVNAVTEYVDHWRMTKTPDAKFDGGQFGKWATLKAQAFDTAVEFLKAA
jgi:phage/plasmid-like protein (TIGR03299 family)